MNYSKSQLRAKVRFLTGIQKELENTVSLDIVDLEGYRKQVKALAKDLDFKLSVKRNPKSKFLTELFFLLDDMHVLTTWIQSKLISEDDPGVQIDKAGKLKTVGRKIVFPSFYKYIPFK